MLAFGFPLGSNISICGDVKSDEQWVCPFTSADTSRTKAYYHGCPPRRGLTSSSQGAMLCMGVADTAAVSHSLSGQAWGKGEETGASVYIRAWDPEGLEPSDT